MNRELKIPTILGLGLLTAGLVGAVVLTAQQQLVKSRASATFQPRNIIVQNVSDTSAAILWQTDTPATGFIKAGTTPTLNFTFNDERDKNAPQPHTLHLATLSGLNPDTIYYYKIQSGSLIFPEKEPLTFRTTTSLPLNNLQSIVGTVVDQNMKPVLEALITLEIPGATQISTITKGGGNFILPLANLKTEDLRSSWQPVAGPGKLTVSDGQQSSVVNFQLSLNQNILPLIILGQNQNLIPTISPTISPLSRYDLNEDGVINSLDVSEVVKNTKKNPKTEQNSSIYKKADLNTDGKVDQKDVEIVSKFITDPISP